MGGAVKALGAPFRWTSNAVTHLVEHPLDIIPAATGVMTGNPWLAAAAAGATTAASGGNTSQILSSAAMSGLGGYTGEALGSTVGKYAGEAFGEGSRLYASAMGEQLGSTIGRAAGFVYGSGSYQRMQDQQRMSFNAPSTISTPSMEEMKNRAILATRQAFSGHGLRSGYGAPSKYMKKINKRRPKYGYMEWKELVRPQNYHA